MTSPIDTPTDRAWARIEEEKRRDRFIRRVSIAAWSATFVIVVLVTAATVIQYLALRPVMGGITGVTGMGAAALVGLMMPLLIGLGVLSVLIATLATVGQFLRLRTASLVEIQLRLAALEAAITGGAGDPPPR